MKSSQIIKSISISILVAGGLIACDQPGPAETVGKNIDKTFDTAGNTVRDVAYKASETITEKSHKVGVAMSDAEITTRVKAAIFTAPGLDTLKISVDTVKGVVSLNGVVDTKTQKALAEALASEVPDVSRVNNQLIIKTN